LGQLGIFGEARAAQAFEKKKKKSAQSGHVVAEELVDVRTFLQVFAEEQRRERKRMGAQCGFSAQEVQDLKNIFNYYDKDGAGDLGPKDEIRIITDLYPEIAHDAEMRPLLLEVVRNVDEHRKTERLEFKDFLRLMQHLRDLKDQTKVNKEMSAVKNCGFSVQEVQEFRQLFLEGDNGYGEFSLEEAQRILGKVTPLGAGYLKELAQIFGDVSGGEVDVVDFPDFLLLMKRLIDVNFARIRDITSALSHENSAVGGGAVSATTTGMAYDGLGSTTSLDL